MKTLKPLFLLAAFFMLVPLACKKSDNKPKTTAVSMTFKFNGTAQTASLVVATYYKSQNSVQIAGVTGSQGLNLTIEDIKAGTFNLATDPTLIASFSTALDQDHTYFGTAGKIVITTFSADAIAGTFEFSGMDGLGQAGTITDGTFSAKLITQ